jgi:lysophospholipase L1-like esterase
MDYTGKKFSILGDSISTFKGVTVDDPNTFYGSVMCQKGGLTGAQDTWWMQVITALGGVLERDNAYSGSCITDGYGLGRGACTEERTSALGSPDVILIFMGGNDMGFQVPETEFRQAYPLLLSRLKKAYPQAEIWCATLINGKKVLPDEPYFMGSDPATALEPFSSIIRQAVAEAGVHLVDLAQSGLRYDTIDGCHPTRSGMEQLADLWLRAIRD